MRNWLSFRGGVAVGLPSTEDNWSQIIADVATEFMNCVINIVDPNQSVTTPYDPATGEGGESTPLVLYTGVPARAQHIRAPYNVPSAVDWNSYRHYRFQVKLEDVPGLVSKGMQIEVTGAGRDASILDLTYTIEASTNSSHAAVRTFETVAPNSVSP